MAKNNSIKTGNIIVLVIILAILGVAVFTATQDGTYINELVKKAEWFNYTLSAFGFIGAIGLIVKYSKDSKEGIGFSIGKAFTILIAAAVAIGAFYL